MEAFDETYHVPGTHPEFMRFGTFIGWGRPQGKHSHIGYDAAKGMDENKAKRGLISICTAGGMGVTAILER